MSTAKPAPDDVLVIGAGPAGITSACFLQKAGISYKVIDRANEIGSTWNSLYPSLRLNTTRFYSHIEGVRFPWRYGIFPTGRQYHEYLTNFVRQNNFNIELGVEVQRVSPEAGCWRVEMSTGVWLYKAVISATGVFGNPITPYIPGMETFTGTLIHAHDFIDPEQLRGKRVLVIGNGPSGIDISVAAAETAESVSIAIRSGINMFRRYPYGLPSHGWLMLSLFLPKRWCNWFLSRVSKVPYHDQERYGLRRPAPGQGGITAYQGRELLEAVKRGKIKPIVAPICFSGSQVEFADGTHAAFDVVIMATGYEPVLQKYLDIEMQFSEDAWTPPGPCEWEIGPNGQRGFPVLDRTQHPNGRQVVGYPGLYVVGIYYKGKGAMHNFNVEASIAAEQIRDYLTQLSAVNPVRF
jgi:putative flavoprotein involved in K+ transport